MRPLPIPQDTVSPRTPTIKRCSDGRERHLVPVTLGRDEYVMVVRRHPGTGDVHVQLARAKGLS